MISILEKGKPCIHGNSKNSNEYMRNSRLVNSEIEFTDKVNEIVAYNSAIRLSATAESCVYIPFDGTEIRKPFTEQSESLDKVQSLDGSWVNGYHTVSTIAVSDKSHEVTILEHTIYSTKDFSKTKSDPNSKTEIYLDLLSSTSARLKEVNPKLENVFLGDREFDNIRIMQAIDDQGDKFVIRAKDNKRSVIRINNQLNPVETVTVNKLKYKHKIIKKISELKIKKRLYKNLTLKLSYETVEIKNSLGKTSEVTYISSILLDEDKKPVFKNDNFVLVTNKAIKTKDDAFQAYLNYFIRWKIETVFKFLKTTLGLEKFRVPAMSAIKNMISLVFILGAYLINLGEVEIDESYINILAKLGCGKGSVTPFYIRQGLQVLIHYVQAEEYLATLTTETSKELLDIVRKGRGRGYLC